MARVDGLRLLLALGFSSALHFSLIYGIGVGPSRSVPPSIIVARLASPAAAPSAETSAPRNQRGVPVAAPVFVQSSAEPALAATRAAPGEAGPEQIAAAPARTDDSRLPGADVPLLVDPAWYEAKDLDSYPQPLTAVQPVYPPSAADISGEVTLLLQVDEFGAVHELSVAAAEPAGYFEEAALGAFQLVRFAPAQREGQPVRSRIVIKVRFAPQRHDIDER
jgi:periplasmic protein TonB